MKQSCPGSEQPAAVHAGPWRGLCAHCGRTFQVRLDGTLRRHAGTAAEIEAWHHEQDERQNGPGWPAKPRIVCPWLLLIVLGALPPGLLLWRHVRAVA
jgi:hypothetical protein